MAKTLIAAKVLPGVTYCAADGTPYRADPSGIVHMEPTHLAEMTTRGVATTASNTDLTGTSHQGRALTIISGNG